ncbi:MAG: hypothetical protein A2Y17_04940 [Clostridiales bacterium GWF2_38_85]|nr:MAG: hypothetical protein A2Y17_04940 [Clostridiales bacterium GWF2_38_85]HBL84366.1 hypothetical protein [Clostridiales bacterium]
MRNIFNDGFRFISRVAADTFMPLDSFIYICVFDITIFSTASVKRSAEYFFYSPALSRYPDKSAVTNLNIG